MVLTACNKWANIKKKCDNTALGIASQDCKEQCGVAEPGEDCAKCVGTHKDYDYDCKNIGFASWCVRPLYMKIRKEDCKEKCRLGDSLKVCGNCIRNHQDYGLPCLIFHHVEPNPPPPPSGQP